MRNMNEKALEKKTKNKWPFYSFAGFIVLRGSGIPVVDFFVSSHKFGMMSEAQNASSSVAKSPECCRLCAVQILSNSPLGVCQECSQKISAQSAHDQGYHISVQFHAVFSCISCIAIFCCFA